MLKHAYFEPTDCSLECAKRMQMSWSHRKLQYENVLETVGELQRYRIKTKGNLFQSHAGFI